MGGRNDRLFENVVGSGFEKNKNKKLVRERMGFCWKFG